MRQGRGPQKRLNLDFLSQPKASPVVQKVGTTAVDAAEETSSKPVSELSLLEAAERARPAIPQFSSTKNQQVVGNIQAYTGKKQQKARQHVHRGPKPRLLDSA